MSDFALAGLPHFADLTIKEISEMNTIRQPFAIDETAEDDEKSSSLFLSLHKLFLALTLQ
jgi:hypothetical protein